MPDRNTYLQQILGRNNPYTTSARIMSLNPYQARPSDSIGTVLGVGLGQAALTAVLGGLAKRQNREQMQLINDNMNSLYTDPENFTNPGIDSEAFQYLKNQALEERRAIGIKRMLDVEKRMLDIGDQQYLMDAKAQQDIIAESPEYRREVLASFLGRKGEGSPIETKPSVSDYMVQGKTRDDFKRDEDRSFTIFEKVRATPEVKEFRYVDQGLRALKEAIQDPSPVADAEIIRRGIQAIEPGLAVRLDDQQALEGATSIPSQLKQAMMKAITGGPSLTETQRIGILRIAERAHQQKAVDYNDTITRFQKVAKRNNLDLQTAVPFELAKVGSGYTPYPTEDEASPAPAPTPQGIPGVSREAIIAELKRRGAM